MRPLVVRGTRYRRSFPHGTRFENHGRGGCLIHKQALSLVWGPLAWGDVPTQAPSRSPEEPDPLNPSVLGPYLSASSFPGPGFGSTF